jgi:hypothetical protein
MTGQQEAAMNVTTARRIAIGALVLGASLIAFAVPSSADTVTAAQRAACTPDAFRLCSKEFPSVSAVTACMTKNFENLSPQCRATLLPK